MIKHSRSSFDEVVAGRFGGSVSDGLRHRACFSIVNYALRRQYTLMVWYGNTTAIGLPSVALSGPAINGHFFGILLISSPTFSLSKKHIAEETIWLRRLLRSSTSSNVGDRKFTFEAVFLVWK